MFTLRVEPDGPRGGRTVCACKAYDVSTEQAGRLARIVLDGNGAAPIIVRDGGCVYVMNDGGVTVDVIRTAAAAKKQEEIHGV